MGFGVGKIVKATKKAVLETKGKNAFSAKDTTTSLKQRERKIKKLVEEK